MIRRSRVSLAWLVAMMAPAALVSTPLSAQMRPGGPPTEQRQRLEQQVRERFEAMIRSELGIDEETSVALREVVDRFSGDRRELSQRQQSLRRRLRSSGSLLDADEARSVLDELVAVQQAEVDLLSEEQAALLQILSAPQLVRFYMLREQLGERVRNLRGGGADAARRPGGGGQPPRPSVSTRQPGEGGR